MARTKPWKVTDEFWEKVRPLIPPAPSHAKGGRTRMDDRDAFAAMIYVLRTGIQWNALPRQMGALPPCMTATRNGSGWGSSRSCGGRGCWSTRNSKASSGSGRPSMVG
jgi:transposase